MEFILLIRDMQILVTCRFEMLIFKSSRVIKYNVMFAFLFVQTVSVYSTFSSFILWTKFRFHEYS